MTEMKENSFDVVVRLKMWDYYRYYFSLLNLKLSGKLITAISALVVAVYGIAFVSSVYAAAITPGFSFRELKQPAISFIIMFLFSTAFTRTYLIAYRDARTHKFLDKNIRMVLSEDRLVVGPDSWNKEYRWKKMYRIIEFSYGFVLFIDKKDEIFMLPKRCFKGTEQLQFMRDIIKKYNK